MISHSCGLAIERMHRERRAEEARKAKADEEARQKSERTLWLNSDHMPVSEIEEACAVLKSEPALRLEHLAAWGGKIQRMSYSVDLAEIPKLKLGELYAVLGTNPGHRRKINDILERM